MSKVQQKVMLHATDQQLKVGIERRYFGRAGVK
jgi:hypothetical protein